MDEALEVAAAEGGAVGSVQVVVAVPVEGSAEAAGAVEVRPRRPHCQAHSPVAHVGAQKCPRGKQHLEEETQSHREMSWLKSPPCTPTPPTPGRVERGAALTSPGLLKTLREVLR